MPLLKNSPITKECFIFGSNNSPHNWLNAQMVMKSNFIIPGFLTHYNRGLVSNFTEWATKNTEYESILRSYVSSDIVHIITFINAQGFELSFYYKEFISDTYPFYPYSSTSIYSSDIKISSVIDNGWQRWSFSPTQAALIDEFFSHPFSTYHKVHQETSLYNKSSQKSKFLAILFKDSKVELLALWHEWAKVQVCSSNLFGWVPLSALSPVP